MRGRCGVSTSPLLCGSWDISLLSTPVFGDGGGEAASVMSVDGLAAGGDMLSRGGSTGDLMGV